VRVSDLIQVSGSGRIAPSSIVFETLGAANAGDLRLATNQLLILDGGNVSAQTIGTGQAGTLAIEAKNIQVSGNSADGRFRSRLFLNSSGSGDAGKLQIQTSTLLVQSGGEVSAATANVGQGGSINLTAANVTIDGTGARGASQLSFRSSGSGNAGGIRLDTDQLTLQNQGQITVEGTGSGNAGNLNLIARAVSLDRQAVLSAQTNSAQGGNISLQNVNTLTLDNNSTISAATVNGQSGTVELQASTLTLNRNSELAAKATGNGTAGSLTIATQTLNLLNGSTATVASVDGAGGNLVVNASQAVTLQGSRLVAEATGNGRAGDLRINADRLTLDRSQAGVDSNQQGGNLAVEARSVFMDNGSRLSATTAAATGGNITLKVQESITLRRDSDIRAEATGTGNGGNVTLEAGRFIFAILSENSDVLAFAPQGQGGNITARADGILTFRQFQRTDTPESDFVASGGSNLLDGSITLDTRNPQPSPPLPNQFANPTLVEGCLATPGNRDRPPRAQNQYFRTGAGGLATSPNEALRSSQIRVPWNRLEDKAATANPTEIREAEGFIRLANGRVRLVSSTRPLAASPCLLGGQP
jgi:large exoprotein involved in heme utilization and adhesion